METAVVAMGEAEKKFGSLSTSERKKAPMT